MEGQVVSEGLAQPNQKVQAIDLTSLTAGIYWMFNLPKQPMFVKQ